MTATENQEPRTYTVLEAAQAASITKNTAKYRLRTAPETFTFKGADGKVRVSATGVQWLIETAQNQAEPPKTRTTGTGEKPVSPETEGKTSGLHPEEPAEEGTSKTTEELLRATENQLNRLMQSTIDQLRERVKSQDAQIAQQARQIDSLLSQNSNLTAAIQTAQTQLSQAQQLHAGTIQQGLLDAQEQQQEQPEPPTGPEDTTPATFGQRMKKAWAAITGKD